MADERQNVKKGKRILADSSNAKWRFGYHGAPGTPIKSSPKLSDLWFIEYKTVSGNKGTTLDISGLAKSVSHISVMTSTMPVDQYGKRIYVPTRVDFPEVTISMYDTVDGRMFRMAEDIYSKFFKNQDAKFTSANAEEVLTSSHMHGRKIPDDKHNYYHQHFEKITVYHFFGNLDKAGPGNRSANAGAGTIQKIDLINPLVTNFTFSSSDYSISELRTVDMSIQPENIIISNEAEANFPDWMTLGMDYMLRELTSTNKHIPEIYPDPFEYEYGAGFKANLFKKTSSKDRGPDIIEDFEEDRINKKSQEERDLTNEGRDAKEEVRKLNNLMKLWNIANENPDSENIEELTKELKDSIGAIDIARRNRYMKSTPPSVDDNQIFATPYEATYENPDVAGFGDRFGNSNPAVDSLPSYSQLDLGSSMINELVSSFFGKRSFSVSNVNNSLFGPGGLKNVLRDVAINGLLEGISGRTVDGSKITDSVNTSRSSNSKSTSAIIVERLPDIVETVYKRGTNTPYSPGVSQVIKDKFK
jgi:hypothetical protein